MQLSLPFTRIDNITKNIKMNKIFIYFILLLSSCFEILFLSLETSPLYNFRDLDAGMFEIIGKSWADGYIPYVTYWDLKGPYLFFCNMLGFLLFKKLYGVAIIEIISLFITKIFLFKMLKLKFNDFISILISSFCIILFCSVQWNYGNTASEWCLPFLAASFYYVYKFYIENKDYHDKKYAFIYGLAFGICILTRAINLIPLFLFCFAIFIYLIIKKQYKNAFENVLFAVLGTLVFPVLFSIYFYSKDALFDMWYGTIIFNISYYKTSANSVDSQKILNTVEDMAFIKEIRLIYSFAILLIFLFYGIRKVIKKDYKKLLLIIPVIFTLLFYITTNCFVHYFIVLLPMYALAFNELKEERFGILGYIITIVYFILPIFIIPNVCGKEIINKNLAIQEDYSILFNEIPQNSTLTMIDARTQSVYLDHNIYPNNKYFDLQSWTCMFSEKLKTDILKDFKENEPDYVIIDRAVRYKCIYDNIIKQDYIRINEIKNDHSWCVLYRKKLRNKLRSFCFKNIREY